MYTFHHYYLTTHLSRIARHDTYLAYPADEPKYRVVLKVFDADCVVPETTLNDVRRMEARLQDLKHPHIVAVLELGMEQGKPYIVSEYQEGGSLRQYLDRLASEHLSLEEAVGVVMQVGQAIAFAHMHGVLHLDIRPENILLDDQGKVLLADFSMGDIVAEVGPQRNSTHRMVSYLAPEQVAGAASSASDQYALGCLLYEIVTGTTPDPSALRLRATLSGLEPSTTLPALPHQIEAVVLRTLALKPQERYPDIVAFLVELKSVVQPEPPAFPCAHLTSHYEQPSSDPAETFPLLLPMTPFRSQSLLDESLLQMSSTGTSLEAFLTTPELDGVSILDRLALVDGQEEALMVSGIPDTSSKEHLLTSKILEPKIDKANPLTEMTLDAILNEDLLAQQPDQDMSGYQEKAPATSIEKKDPVIPPSTFRHQANAPFRHHKRKGYVLLLLILTSLVIIALLLLPFHQTITGMIWRALPTTPSPIAQIRPTALPKPTATPRPTATPILSQPIGSTPIVQPIPTPTPSYGSVQIDAGGTGVGTYSADMDYHGGSVSSTKNTVDTSGVSNPAPESVYQSNRYGYDFIYLIPNLIPNQAYIVRLHFAAMSWTQKGQNVFDVTINGNTALGYFDINAATGGTDKAVVKSFTEIARSDGTLLMQFDADQGYVMVSGIQVLAN